MRKFEQDVGNGFVKGKIIAFSEVLGKDGWEILKELHEIADSKRAEK